MTFVPSRSPPASWRNTETAGRLRDITATALGWVPGRIDRSIRPFLIFSAPRAGSELLVDLLDSRPDVRCDGELFQSPRRAPGAHLRGRARLARLRGCDAWGSKLLFQQLMWFEQDFGGAQQFLQRLDSHGFVLVVLTRRNPILQALSLLHAEQTKFHFDATDDVTFEPLVVDPAEVVAGAFNFDTAAAWARDVVADLPRVDICYEDDLEDPRTHQRTVDRIAAALEMPSIPVSSSLRCVAPRSTSARVANFDDLEATVARTRFAQFVTD